MSLSTYPFLSIDQPLSLFRPSYLYVSLCLCLSLTFTFFVLIYFLSYFHDFANQQFYTNYTATCLPSRKLYRLDEPNTRDTAGEARTSS